MAPETNHPITKQESTWARLLHTPFFYCVIALGFPSGLFDASSKFTLLFLKCSFLVFVLSQNYLAPILYTKDDESINILIRAQIGIGETS